MTETKIRNSEKAAKLLADFDMVDCAQAEVMVCFRDNSIEYVVDRSINVTPGMARRWKYSDWLYFVESTEECYRDIPQLLLDEVVSVVIRFKMSQGSLGIYSVENTCLAKVDGFDRFLSSIPRTGNNYEFLFEPEDRTHIHDAHDALGVVFASGGRSLRLVASDLPYACLHSNV